MALLLRVDSDRMPHPGEFGFTGSLRPTGIVGSVKGMG